MRTRWLTSPAEPGRSFVDSASMRQRLDASVRQRLDQLPSGGAIRAAAQVQPAARGAGRGRLRRGGHGRAAAAASPTRPAGAFFDVDNTLIRGASIYYFARGLAARKMFGPRDLARMAWGQIYFRLRGAENSDHIDAAREAALTFVAGHKVADIVSLSEEIFDETMADRVWAGTRELTQRPPARRPAGVAGHRDAGGAGHGHLAAARADRRAGHGGRVGGRGVHRPPGRRAAARRGQGGRGGARWPSARAWTWPAAPPTATRPTTCRCCRLVGHPNAVNPDAGLRAEARRNDWPVYDFRSGRKATLIALPTAAAHRRGGRRDRRRRSRCTAGTSATAPAQQAEPSRRLTRLVSRTPGRARPAARPACAGSCPGPRRPVRPRPPGPATPRPGSRRSAPAGRTR